MTDVRKYGKMPYLVLLRKVEKWSWIQMDQHQNLIAFRGSLLAHAYQIWSTSINGFLSYHADRPTHTRVITIPAALLLYRRSGKITETPPQRRIVFVVFGKDVFSFHLNVFSNRLIAQGPWKKCKNSTCDSMSCSHASPYGTFFSQKNYLYEADWSVHVFFCDIWTFYQQRICFWIFRKNLKNRLYTDMLRVRVMVRIRFCTLTAMVDQNQSFLC